jgi:lysozyme
MPPRKKVNKKDPDRSLIIGVFLGMVLMFSVLSSAIAYKKKDSILRYLRNYRSGFEVEAHDYHHHYNVSREYEIHGIDISHYQGDVQWDELIKTTYNGKSLRFVFMKATEGSSLKDKKFQRNWEKAKELNLLRGAYHFYRPDVDPGTQAQHFITHAPLGRGDLPPVLDLEIDRGISKKQLLDGIKEWIRIVENHYAVKPIIYVNADFYQRYIKQNFPGYTVWIAHYKTDKPRAAHHEWHFWQYSENGKAAGIKGHVDVNVFNGSLEDLMALAIP